MLHFQVPQSRKGWAGRVSPFSCWRCYPRDDSHLTNSSSQSLGLSKRMPGTEECRCFSTSSAGGFAVTGDSVAVTVCIQCILQIYCKKSGLEILRALSHICCLFQWPQGFQEKCYQALYQTALYLEEAGWCFAQPCVSGKKPGDCELGRFSLRNSLYLQGCGSFFLRQKWEQQGHGAALTLLMLGSLSELWETEMDLPRDLGEWHVLSAWWKNRGWTRLLPLENVLGFQMMGTWAVPRWEVLGKIPTATRVLPCFSTAGGTFG